MVLYSCSFQGIVSNNIEPSFQNGKEIKKNTYVPKIYYLGLGLWGNGEDWSENDVIVLENIFKKIYYNREFHSYIFSNKGLQTKAKLPFFSEKKLEFLIKNIGESVTEKDIIILTISSHGFPGGINYRIGISPSMSLTGDKIEEIIKPIQEKNILFIISSCYSGSLIKYLEGKYSIIFTASSANKPSFGCDKESSNSWFIESLYESYHNYQNTEKRFSLKRWFNKTKSIVKNKEASYGYPHSFPQIFIGKNVNPFVFLL
tara:strand:- start:91 stop:867 length:777 start_codon:yes stop_codon:yes gene_type:complete